MEAFLPAPKQSKYSFRWARTVVDNLYQKYPRATEIVCLVLDITQDNLATYLAKGDNVFPVIREFIHIAARWEHVQGFDGWSIQMLSSLKVVMRQKGPDRIRERLDAVSLKDYPQRAGRKEVAGGGNTDDCHQPLLFEDLYEPSK